MLEQAGDRILARFENLAVAQGAVQPAGQQARAHGGLAAVHDRLQRVLAAAGQIDVQLQVAPTGAVEDHCVVEALVAQAAQVGQGGALGFLGVGKQAAGGADGQRQVLAAEALEVLGGELLAEALECRIAIEIPGRATAHTAAFFQWQTLRPIVGDQQFRRAQALQFREQGFPALEFLHAEAAAGDVQHRQAEQALITDYRSQQVVATLVEQCLVAHRAGGDDAHHLAFYRPFAGRRIADLLADHHRLAKLHQPRQITLGGMERNACHRDRRARRLPACGQGDVEQRGGFLGIVVEQLIEVAHAVEHQLVRMLALESPILLHHRRMGGKVGVGLGHRLACGSLSGG